VVAAVVVLYYTLQDSYREGIPHRRVVVYFVGSWTIGTLFCFENICLIIMSIVHMGERHIFLYGAMLSTLTSQFFILFIIILSSSSDFCRLYVKRAEYRQFCYLMDYPVGDSRYVWNYFVHHMPQVVAGDDMMTDKAVLVHKLLDVPLKYKRRHRKEKDRDIDKRRKWLLLSYEFYFHNLIMTFVQISGNEEECNQIFMTLYEFVSKIPKTDEYFTDQDYLLIVSAVLNAAQVSSLPKSDAFCYHILNHCILQEENRNCQICLYLLFLDHLFRTEAEKVQIKDLHTILGIEQVRFEEKDKETYIDFWVIWSTQSNISHKNSIRYLEEALRGLSREKGFSAVMDFCMRSING